MRERVDLHIAVGGLADGSLRLDGVLGVGDVLARLGGATSDGACADRGSESEERTVHQLREVHDYSLR